MLSAKFLMPQRSMNESRLIVFFSLTFGLTAFAGAEVTVGTISFMEGKVEITRNGRFIAPGKVDVGFTLQMFDTIETGKDGYVEVDMTAPAAGSRVKVRQETSFYFEGTPRKSSFFRTTFHLLRGALGIKVGKILRRESYKVQTDKAVMAVRGTEFTVDMAQDRSVLVTASEGRVEVQASVQTRKVEPGVVAIIEEDKKVSLAKVRPGDIAQYRERWQQSRLEALQINADLSIQHYAALWNRQFPRFEAAMKELAAHNSIFRRWDAIAAGRMDRPPVSRVIRDKWAISRGMLELRSTLPLTERTFFTLIDLEGVYREEESPNAKQFYRTFGGNKRRVRKMLSKARNMIRVFRVMDGTANPSIMDTLPRL